MDIRNAYDAQAFRQIGHWLIDTLADFLRASTEQSLTSVLPDIRPGTMLEQWPGNFPDKPSAEFRPLMQNVLSLSNNLLHPRYLGHQVSSPLPLAALCDLAGTFINNASAVYEMGPVNIAMEKRIVQWMCRLVGYSESSDGILTSGGTIGNLTALLAARQAKTEYNIWSDGIDSEKPLTVLISEQAHYSVRRAVSIMGLGESAVSLVPVDKYFRMDLAALEKKYDQAASLGRTVFAVVGNSCSTATGSYDDLEGIADFAESRSIWFHVDGAHGASALLSDRYRSLLKGVHRADSVVWDAHKMLLMPALITAVLFKDGSHSYESFSQKASYLFEKESREEWYNFAHRTMECTKTMMGLRLYMCLMVYGTRLFSDYIDSMYGLTKAFADCIRESTDFECAVEPESNILCFRYLKEDVNDLNALQIHIRKKIRESETFYIVQAELNNTHYLRCTIIHPLTTLDDLKALLDTIRQCILN
jgi:L-2,4-diaminobutyrate decarboxylase